MNNTFSPDIQKDLRIIGWYQIIGGALGIGVLGIALSKGVYYSNIGIAFYIIFFLLFGYSVLAGWLCVRSNKKAILFSVINQYMQAISFSLSGITYSYVAGVYFFIGIDVTGSFHILLDWGLSQIQLFLVSESKNTFIAINFPALLFIYWLNRLKKQIVLETTIEEADSIGETAIDE